MKNMAAQGIIRKNIEEELKDSYLTYAMSVNTNRAIPDVRDGLKPSTRRIIYAMGQMNLTSNRSYDKCAAVVGEVMKNFHPHGDAAIYATLVGLEQPFGIRYPLIDGQGNFGSIDDDPAGAMRYTECRLSTIANEMLADIQKDVVDFQPNYKDSIDEPTVLPALLPNLLLNGTTGIGVGYLTKIPPHNLNEITDGLMALIDNPELEVDDLMNYIPGPDFPTGATIIGDSEIKDIYSTGRGSVTLRAKINIERTTNTKNNTRDRIIITEIPYQVKKNQLLEKIYQLVSNKTITGITDLRDESDKDIRIIIDLKKGEIAQVVVNQLYKHTNLQTRFNTIMLCLVNGLPEVLNLKEILNHYLEHRRGVVKRRTEYELLRAEKREHILAGYLIAQQNLRAIIELVQEADNPQIALEQLKSRYELSDIQGKEVLGMTLRQLTRLEHQKVKDEYDQVVKEISRLRGILNDKNLIVNIIKEELTYLKNKYGDDRRTQITGSIKHLEVEDLIADEQVIITITHNGYIKRIPAETYTKQHRGGTGMKGLSIKDNDYVEHIFTATTHEYILFFTNIGRCYGLKAFEIPESSRQSSGRSVANLLSKVGPDEVITSYIPVKDFNTEQYIFMCTKNGTVKKCDLQGFSKPTKNGFNAIKLIDKDELKDVQLVTNSSTILLLTKKGHSTRFLESNIKSSGRNTKGLRAIRLTDDVIVEMITSTTDNESLLLITETGYGKRSNLSVYTIKNRGAKSVRAISEANGNIVAGKIVTDDDELFILNSKGNISRISAKDIPIQGRTAQGVRIMKLNSSEQIVDVGKINAYEEE